MSRIVTTVARRLATTFVLTALCALPAVSQAAIVGAQAGLTWKSSDTNTHETGPQVVRPAHTREVAPSAEQKLDGQSQRSLFWPPELNLWSLFNQ